MNIYFWIDIFQKFIASMKDSIVRKLNGRRDLQYFATDERTDQGQRIYTAKTRKGTIVSKTGKQSKTSKDDDGMEVRYSMTLLVSRLISRPLFTNQWKGQRAWRGKS